MNKTIFKCTLDIHDIYSQFTISIKKGDTSGRLVITLMEKGKPYQIPEGSYASFVATSPNGGTLHNGCIIEDNTIIYDMTEATTKSAGTIEPEIELIDRYGIRIVSPRFTIKVFNSVYSEEDVENSNEYTSLTNLIKEANNLIVDVNKKLDNGDFVGEQGVSITNVSLDNHELGVTLSDGTVYELGNIRGERGEKGEKGDKGDQGLKGADAVPTLLPVERFGSDEANLEVGKTYKVYTTLTDVGDTISGDIYKYDCAINIQVSNPSQLTLIATKDILEACNVRTLEFYDQTFTCKVAYLDHQKLIFFINKEKYTLTPSDLGLDGWIYMSGLVLKGATKVYEYNEDATLIGVKGDKGDKGDQGVSVSNVSLDNYELEMTFSNGEKHNLGNIRGEKGEKGEKGEQGDGYNADVIADVALLKQAMLQSGSITSLEVEQAYTSRVTANGENIVDGQKTPVMLIKGDTVKSANLIPFPYQAPYNVIQDGVTISGVTFSVDNYGITTVNGTVETNFNAVFRDYFPVKAGQVFSFSSNGASFTGCMMTLLVSKEKSVTGAQYASEGSSGRTYTIEEGYNYGRVVINFAKGTVVNNVVFKPMLNEGPTLFPFQPYFAGLKHAYINNIVSTNADGTEEDTYQLPETLELGKWDSFNPQTGELTSGTGRYEVTGEENWQKSPYGNDTETGIYRYDLNISSLPKIAGKASASVTKDGCICSHFSIIDAGTIIVGAWCFVPEGSGVGFRIRDKFATVDDLKAWLKSQKDNGTPVIFEYKLATPTVETIENVPKSYTAYNGGSETIVQGETDNSEYGAMPTIVNEYFKLTEV